MAIPADRVRRPDPAIYAQEEVSANPADVVGANPDLVLFGGAGPVASLRPTPAGLVTIQVAVHNRSAEVTADSVQVHLYEGAFGLGAAILDRTDTGVTALVNVPPSGTSITNLPWVPSLGEASLLVTLVHPNDANPGNNEGWHSTWIEPVDAGSGRWRPRVPVFNPFAGTTLIRIAIFEEGPTRWFPLVEVEVGDGGSALPVGFVRDVDLLGTIVDTTAIEISMATTLHRTHFVGYAYASAGASGRLLGAITYGVQLT